MATESDIQLITGGSGPVLRTLNVTTVINGVPTTVQMEVAALSDTYGNVIPLDITDKLKETNILLRAVLEVLCERQGVLFEDMVTVASQRGSTVNMSEA